MSDFDSFDSLTESPEDRALAVDLADNRLPWLADGLAIERAKRKGHELGEIISELQVIDRLMQADEEDSDPAELANEFSNVYPATARLLWLGFLRFEEEIEFEAILGAVGPGTLQSVPLGKMMQQLFPENDEEGAESDSGEGNAEGK